MPAQLTGLALIASALTDVAISLDMLWSGGRYSPMVVSAATTLILLLLGIGAVTAGQEEVGEGSGEGERTGAGQRTEERIWRCLQQCARSSLVQCQSR